VKGSCSRVPLWLRWRGAVQAASFVFANSYLLRGWKGFCYPGLNCWACPAANFACPIGALQNAAISAPQSLAGGAPWWGVVPIYTLGTLIFFAALFGRMMCGWICPFGWFQELVGRLRKHKYKVPRQLSYLRYVILLVLVFIIPYYTGEPWFTKLCPQGALEAGLTQPLINPALRPMIHGFWFLKIAILVACFIAALFFRRPFCSVICPLGAIFSLFNRISAWQIRFDEQNCVNCMWCVNNCPQGIDPRTAVNGHDCISCLVCQQCPYGAIYSAPIWARPRNHDGQRYETTQFSES